MLNKIKNLCSLRIQEMVAWASGSWFDGFQKSKSRKQRTLFDPFLFPFFLQFKTSELGMAKWSHKRFMWIPNYSESTSNKTFRHANRLPCLYKSPSSWIVGESLWKFVCLPKLQFLVWVWNESYRHKWEFQNYLRLDSLINRGPFPLSLNI